MAAVCRKRFFTVTRLAGILALLWLFGIFVLIQRASLDEDMDRISRHLRIKRPSKILGNLKDIEDNEIIEELIKRSNSRDDIRKSILKHWLKTQQLNSADSNSLNLNIKDKMGDMKSRKVGKPENEGQIQPYQEKRQDVQQQQQQQRDQQPLQLFKFQPKESINIGINETQGQDQLREIDLVKELDGPAYDPNGPGEGGKGVDIQPEKLSPDEKAKYDDGWKKNAFNQYASDKISLHRKLGDILEPECKLRTYRENLPDASVVIIFHNEALSVLLRTLHSVLDTSRPKLLKEVFLVDDCSDREELLQPLDDYLVNMPNVHVLRLKSRVGLIRARLHGFSHVTSKVSIFLDSHCECVPGWLEPLLDRIAENERTVAIPIADIINDKTFAYDFRRTDDIVLGGLDLDLNFNWRPIPQREKDRRAAKHDPLRTPTFLGCCFAISVDFFKQLGTYDDGFDIWGAEHLELSFKTWMCGGVMEYIPCSHVGHLFRTWSPYTWRTETDALRRNNLRLAEVWLDEYKMFFYDRIYYKLIDYGDVSSRKQLRASLQCKDFGWYINNIYPELYLPIDSQATGMIRSKKESQCVETSVQWFNFNHPAYLVPCNTGSTIQHWTLTKKSQIRRDENCLDHDGKELLVVKPCTEASGSVWKYRQDNSIQHAQSGLCLEMDADQKHLYMRTCTGVDRQLWDWDRRRLTLPPSGQQVGQLVGA